MNFYTNCDINWTHGDMQFLWDGYSTSGKI